MTTIEQLVRQFITHPGVHRPWLLGELYGEEARKQSAPFSHKLLGTNGRHFTPEELEKLNQIRRRFLSEFIP